MKKVIYSITKLGKIENTKITGIGYITDDDLITANVSKPGRPYPRRRTHAPLCRADAVR